MNEKEAGKECCCHKTKTRSPEEYKKLVNRLNRIEGQIRCIRIGKNIRIPQSALLDYLNQA